MPMLCLARKSSSIFRARCGRGDSSAWSVRALLSRHTRDCRCVRGVRSIRRTTAARTFSRAGRVARGRDRRGDESREDARSRGCARNLFRRGPRAIADDSDMLAARASRPVAWMWPFGSGQIQDARPCRRTAIDLMRVSSSRSPMSPRAAIYEPVPRRSQCDAGEQVVA